MKVEMFTFLVTGAICLAGALGVVLFRNPVHNALSLIATLFGVAVLFISSSGPIIAALAAPALAIAFWRCFLGSAATAPWKRAVISRARATLASRGLRPSATARFQPAMAAGYIARFDLESSNEFNWRGARESLRRAQALAPADAEVVPHPRALAVIDEVLSEAGVPHDRGLTWTTDAFFRETRGKVARRREQGCITVEMEASAMFACAAFRGATYGQLLYAGDDVSAQEWDHRHWAHQTSAREHLLDLALEAVVRL